MRCYATGQTHGALAAGTCVIIRRRIAWREMLQLLLRRTVPTRYSLQGWCCKCLRFAYRPSPSNRSDEIFASWIELSGRICATCTRGVIVTVLINKRYMFSLLGRCQKYAAINDRCHHQVYVIHKYAISDRFITTIAHSTH